MFGESDIPHARDGGARLGGGSRGGERDEWSRAARSFPDPPADNPSGGRPVVLIPENQWGVGERLEDEEERGRSKLIAGMVVIACVVGGTVAYVVQRANAPAIAAPTVVASSGETASTSARPLPAAPVSTTPSPSPRAELEIGALPGGAQVTVNGRGVKTSHLLLDSGTYVVRVSAPGYQDRSDELKLVPGRVTAWMPRLTPLPTSQRERPAAHRHASPPSPRPRTAGIAPPRTHAAPAAPARTTSPTSAHVVRPPAPSASRSPSRNAISCAAAYGDRDWGAAAAACGREARAGRVSAQRNLGVMYDVGLGVAKDHLEAARWFRRAADAGSRDAAYQLGTMYHEGRGVGRDDGEAVRWFRRAALLGDPDAQVQLGMAYERGQGVPLDPGQAMHWFHEAAGHGDAWAQNHIGWMYANGKGVPIDYVQAVWWFRRAAASGSAQAQYNLGYMYTNGLGVRRSAADAAEWYRRAAEQGNADARRALHMMGVRP